MKTTAVTRAIPDPTVEPTMPVSRAGAILGISPRKAYIEVERGEIPSIRIGRKIVVPTARFLSKYPELLPEQPTDS